MNFLSNIKEEYKNINMNYLPPKIKKIFDEEDLLKLKKFSFALKYYQEFEKTRKEKINRFVDIEDSNDLIAYMIINSNLKVESNEEIQFSIDYIKSQNSKKIINNLNCENYQRISQRIISDDFYLHMSKIKEMQEKINTLMQKIISFEENFKDDLESYQIFVDKNFDYKRVQIKNIYQKLDIEEKGKLIDLIMSNKELVINEPVEKNSFYILLDILYNDNVKISQKVLNGHPYLMFERCNEIQVIDYLTFKDFDFVDSQELKKRIKAYVKFKYYGSDNLILRQKENDFKRKCLALLERKKNMISDLISENYLNLGTSL